MESVIKLSALNPRSIEIRLIEGRDQAYIRVNEDYFSLVTGTKIDISSALQKGVNLLNLMIKTYPLTERIRRGLFGQDWCGRFELYIDGKLRGTYNQNGGENSILKSLILLLPLLPLIPLLPLLPSKNNF